MECPFHRIAYDYSHTDWDSLCDPLRDVPGRIFLNSVLLLLVVNFVSGFRLEFMYISLIISIRSSFIHLHDFQLLVLLNKSFKSKVKFRQASNYCKRVLEPAALAYAIKTKEPITSQKLGSLETWDF